MPPTRLEPDAEKKPIRTADGTAFFYATIVETKLQLPFRGAGGTDLNDRPYIAQVGSG
jgi:hypothetical protein